MSELILVALGVFGTIASVSYVIHIIVTLTSFDKTWRDIFPLNIRVTTRDNIEREKRIHKRIQSDNDRKIGHWREKYEKLYEEFSGGRNFQKELDRAIKDRENQLIAKGYSDCLKSLRTNINVSVDKIEVKPEGK